jgi:hypothetical protein
MASAVAGVDRQSALALAASRHGSPRQADQAVSVWPPGYSCVSRRDRDDRMIGDAGETARKQHGKKTQIEVITSVEHQPRWSSAEKERLVAVSPEPEL